MGRRGQQIWPRKKVSFEMATAIASLGERGALGAG